MLKETTATAAGTTAGEARFPAFDIKGLSFRFEGTDREIISEMSFEILTGAFVSIVGPNGAGKSTLMDILLGYNRHYSGSAKFLGRELKEYAPAQLAYKRAYIPQQSEVGLRMSAREYLKLSNADPRATTDAEIKEVLERFGGDHLAERSMNHMSGGEARLVQLAFALLRKPAVLLLDEPVSYLDYRNQQAFFETLKRERKARGLTVVSILHDLDLAAYYSDSVMLINEGRILKFGAPTEVLNYKTLGSVFFEGAPGVPPARHAGEPGAAGGAGTKRARVHVICGGGSGEKIISKLASMNLSVACGVLNAGDSDWRFCRAAGVPMIEEEPYRPISDENYAKNLESIRRSDAVVVCEFPLGNGNLANLKFIDEPGCAEGKRIFLAHNESSKYGLMREAGGAAAAGGLDFTGGAADAYLKKIKARAELFSRIEELEKLIDTI